MVFSSDLLRTKQTAEIVSQKLKIKPKFDKRLREIGFGYLNGRSAEELLYLNLEKERIDHSFQKSETYVSVLKRVYNFLRDVEKKYKGKNILIIKAVDCAYCLSFANSFKYGFFILTQFLLKHRF